MKVLNKGTVAVFEEAPEPIGVSVYPLIQGAQRDEVGIGKKGELGLGEKEARMATGFKMVLMVPKEAPTVIIQRNLTQLHGGYHRLALSTIREDEWHTFVMVDHIKVFRQQGMVWTPWRATVPNRLDIWTVSPEGLASLFQVGVVVRGTGEGQYFRIASDLRGEWDLYKTQNGRVDGVPTLPKWGAFSVRGEAILQDVEFRGLLSRANLSRKDPKTEELRPPLSRIPDGCARMQWWSPFTGLRGQGPCILSDGASAWVCGEDVLEAEPDEDGIVRLPRNTLVSYKGLQEKWGLNTDNRQDNRQGKRQEGQPKLLCVRVVE